MNTIQQVSSSLQLSFSNVCSHESSNWLSKHIAMATQTLVCIIIIISSSSSNNMECRWAMHAHTIAWQLITWKLELQWNARTNERSLYGHSLSSALVRTPLPPFSVSAVRRPAEARLRILAPCGDGIRNVGLPITLRDETDFRHPRPCSSQRAVVFCRRRARAAQWQLAVGRLRPGDDENRSTCTLDGCR